MSYGLKYYGTFKNYFDETITVNIYGRDYSGISEEVLFAEGQECIVSYPGDDTNIYNPIFGSQAKVTMISETDFQFIDLHTSDARGYRLDVLKNGSLDWRGWIIPDLFSEPYIAPPYPVTITARCGLGELKERDIPETMTKLLKTTDLVVDIDSFVNLYTIIGNGLLGIDTDLPLNDCINVHHVLSATVNDSALYDTYIDLSSYEGLNYYEAISDILKTFGARIYQQNGEWWIVRIKELEQTLTVRKWTLNSQNNNSFVLNETKLTTFLIGRPAQSDIVNNSPSLDILPAWKEFNIIQKVERKGSLLKNSDFSEWEGLYEDNRDEPVDFKIKEWKESEPDLLSLQFEQDGSKFAVFNASTNKDSATPYIEQTIDNIEVTTGQRLKFNFVIKVLKGNFNITASDFYIVIKTTGLPFDYYLVVNEDNDLEWTTDENIARSNILIEDFPIETKKRQTQFESVELTTPGVLSEGSISVKIYNDAYNSSRLAIKEASCKVLDRNEVEYPDIETKYSVINPNNIYIADDIEVIGGDLKDIPNNRHIWKNYYAESDGNPTVDWNETGETDDYPLLQILVNDYKSRFFQPQFKLSLPILSQNIQFDSCIVDYQILPKKYICNSAEINYRTNIFDGIFIEFSRWENAVWILETGFWNSEGIWIDSETWNDDQSNLIEINLENRTLDGLFNITSQLGITTGDTIEQLLPDSGLTFGDKLMEDSTEIITVPHTFTGTNLYLESSLFKPTPYTTNFKATITGVLKDIKINVLS